MCLAVSFEHHAERAQGDEWRSGVAQPVGPQGRADALALLAVGPREVVRGQRGGPSRRIARL
jgi:hypothetical protein